MLGIVGFQLTSTACTPGVADSRISLAGVTVYKKHISTKRCLQLQKTLTCFANEGIS